MKFARLHWVALALFGMAWSLPARASDALEKTEHALCGGHVAQLRGAELAKALTSVQIRFAEEPGSCPGAGWPGSPWLLELLSDGRYELWLDRGIRRTGRYSFKDDQLCLNGAPWRDCANFYRDEGGRTYASAPLAKGNVPALINYITLAGK